MNIKAFASASVIAFWMPSLLLAGSGPRYKISNDIGSGFYDLHKAGNFKPSEYGLTVVNDIVRVGNKALRFEVRHGDCGKGTGGWSDCREDRERRELNSGDGRSSRDYMKGEHWIAWSMYFPGSHQNLFPLSITYGQFKENDHRGDIYQPVFQTKETARGYSIIRTISACGVEGCVHEEELLIPKEDMVGKWHDILVHMKWSKKDDGFFKMFVNDELKYNYKGRTQSKYRAVMYQFGIYRTGITRYLNYKNVDNIWSCFQEKGYTVEENTALYRLERRKQIRLKESMNLYKKCKEFYDPEIVVPTTIVYYDEVRKGKTKDAVTK